MEDAPVTTITPANLIVHDDDDGFDEDGRLLPSAPLPPPET
jgi:hypothetical protein